MDDTTGEFMKQKVFAVIGASENPEKFGNKIFHNLKDRGYEVYPVNQKLKILDGVKVYSSLSDIPVTVDVVDFVVPPKVTEEILKECKEIGITRIWLQPGSESEAAIEYCKANGMQVLHGV